MEHITISKVYANPNDIKIPKQAIADIKNITSGGKDVLCIYSSSAKAIYFFPVQSPVYQIKILIYPLTSEIVAKIMSKVSELANKVLYSTGLCLVENKCYWEGYIQEKDLFVSKEQIIEIFQSIDEVQDIEVSKIKNTEE
ncbi:MAG: hypothetical protein ACTSYD_13320 [Candidatus Heimdallarchaeaceae archaeon]